MLYPAVSASQRMVGAEISVKFWRGKREDFEFKDFDDLDTLQTTKYMIEKQERMEIGVSPSKYSDDTTETEDDSSVYFDSC